jgi:FlgD Ig-like domain
MSPIRDSRETAAARRGRRITPERSVPARVRTIPAFLRASIAAVIVGAALISAARPASATFIIEQVDPTATTVMFPTHLRLDSMGEPHIVYHRTFAAPAGIQYASRSGTIWSIERVSPVGDYCSFDLDSQDMPHVAWGNGAGWDLRYMSKSGGAWSIETVDVGAVIVPSIALDSGDEPFIAYPWVGGGGAGQLRVAMRSGGAWTIEGVDASAQPFEFVSLALTGADEPRVAYMEAGPVNSRLLYAYRTTGAWTVEEADAALVSEGRYASLALDENGDPHISYLGAGNVLRYASRIAGIWTAETVEAVGVSNGTSIEVDPDGNPHIVYHRGNSDLAHAWKAAGAWTVEAVDGSANNRGAFCSLELDAAGLPYASYFDDTAQDVLYVEPDVITGLPGAPDDAKPGDIAGANANGAAAFLSVRPSVIGAGGATVHLRVPQSNAGANAGVDLGVFDVAGRRVATLALGSSTSGATALGWDGRDADGRSLPSGAYFLRLTAGANAAATERVVIVR